MAGCRPSKHEMGVSQGLGSQGMVVKAQSERPSWRSSCVNIGGFHTGREARGQCTLQGNPNSNDSDQVYAGRALNPASAAVGLH